MEVREKRTSSFWSDSYPGDLPMRSGSCGSAVAVNGMVVENGSYKFPHVPILSNLSRRLKKHYFLNTLSPSQSVLEIGCGDGWVSRHLRQRGVTRVVDIDTTPAAAINGDIRDWKNLGLRPATFDVIVAFEVMEHVDCMQDCFALLKTGGILMITSPYPLADPLLELLEKWRLNQPRTSPHDHLTYFGETQMFAVDRMCRPLGLSQWCILRKKPEPRSTFLACEDPRQISIESGDLIPSC